MCRTESGVRSTVGTTGTCASEHVDVSSRMAFQSQMSPVRGLFALLVDVWQMPARRESTALLCRVGHGSGASRSNPGPTSRRMSVSKITNDERVTIWVRLATWTRFHEHLLFQWLTIASAALTSQRSSHLGTLNDLTGRSTRFPSANPRPHLKRRSLIKEQSSPRIAPSLSAAAWDPQRRPSRRRELGPPIPAAPFFNRPIPRHARGMRSHGISWRRGIPVAHWARYDAGKRAVVLLCRFCCIRTPYRRLGFEKVNGRARRKSLISVGIESSCRIR